MTRWIGWLFGFCIFGVGVSGVLYGAEPQIPKGVQAALRRAIEADATWCMKKRVPALKRPLISRGQVSCKVGAGFIWVTEYPFRHEIRITPQTMTFLKPGEKIVKSADDLPYYKQICALTDAFSEGRTEPFEKLFRNVSVIVGENGGWELRLEPIQQVQNLFSSVRLFGKNTLERAWFRSPDGTEMVLDFCEVGYQTARLWSDSERKINVP